MARHKIGLEEGIRTAKEIGFDTYDIFEDPLDIDDDDAPADQGDRARRSGCRSGRSSASRSASSTSIRRCAGSRSTGSRRTSTRAPIFGARNVLLVVGEYYWDCEVFPKHAIWDMAKDMVKEAGEYAQSKGLEIVLELEPFEQALLKDVHELVRFVRRDRPPGRARERRHLAPAPLQCVVRRRRRS